jgi:outer membrane protein insertion porin family
MLFLLALLLSIYPTLPAQDPVTVALAPQENAPQQQDILADLSRRNIEIQFTGNKLFSNQELLDLLARDDPRALQYLTEDVKDNEKIDYSLRLIRNCLAAQGYLRAKASRPSIEQLEHGYKIVVPIHEGARYRVGQIKIADAAVFTSAEIRNMLGFQEGDVARGEIIYRGIYERLKQAYGTKGYIQFSAEADPTFHRPLPGASEGTVDFAITLDEGKAFTVQAIEFRGNDTVPEGVLRAALRLQVGQTYSSKLMEESIDSLNDLDLFARLDKDRDIGFESDEKAGLVKLIFDFRAKNQP